MPNPQVQASVLAPSPGLRPYVRQFMVIENFANRSNTLLPEAAIIAGFRFRGAPLPDVKALRDSTPFLTTCGKVRQPACDRSLFAHGGYGVNSHRFVRGLIAGQHGDDRQQRRHAYRRHRVCGRYAVEKPAQKAG